MAELDKPRCVRIISDVIESLDASLDEHANVANYLTMEDMLEGDADLRADKEAMVSLKDYLERDCE